MSIHETVTMIAGDDWQFLATMYDENGDKVDLTGATLKWNLLDRDYKAALPSGGFIIAQGAGLGEVVVTVPAASSSTLEGDLYTDAWRITVGGITHTPLTGTIGV